MVVRLSVFSRNFFSLVGSNFTVQALRFLTIALLARRLGASVFGAYSYIVLLIQYGFTLGEFGLKNLAIREISQGRGSLDLVKKIIKVRAALAFLGVGGVVFFSYLAFPNGEYLLPSFFFGLSLFIDAFLVDFIVIAREKLTAQAVANISQALFVYVASYFWVKSSSQFVLFSELFLASHVLWVLLFFLSARPFHFPQTDQKSHAVEIALQGLPFLVALFLFSMQANTDLLLLGQFHFTSLLGDYAVAMKILSIPTGVIFALISTMQPRLAQSSEDLRSRSMQSLLHATTRLIWIFSIPMILGSWLFGEQLVIWLFGSGYPLAHQFLRPLSLSTTFYFLGLTPMMAVLVSHKMSAMIKISAFNLAVSFGCAFAVLWASRPELLPWAMVFAQFVFMIVTWIPFEKMGAVSLEDLKGLAIPALLMMGPLLFVSSPMLKFTLATCGYTCGLAAMGFWRKPWMKEFYIK